MGRFRIEVRHLVDWSAAVYAGIIAGIVFLLALLIAYPLVTGGTPWTIFRFIGALVLATRCCPAHDV